jgi:hypothetical protein
MECKVNDMVYTQLLCFQFNHYPLLQIIFSILLYSFIQFEINVIFQSVLYAILCCVLLVSFQLTLSCGDEEEEEEWKKEIQFSREELRILKLNLL